ncbi:hypothetical protein KDK_31840 [Dictyobacter kobayashii]|uniref:Uncharacterized protein n=1 Tax=Dictyobacter kobayashii TaxID=2014872 RepID=A0A402AK06_9CHLR|nr:hypothetical protein KDK_31840 [Dictyobacter kobayashii]
MKTLDKACLDVLIYFGCRKNNYFKVRTTITWSLRDFKFLTVKMSNAGYMCLIFWMFETIGEGKRLEKLV